MTNIWTFRNPVIVALLLAFAPEMAHAQSGLDCFTGYYRDGEDVYRIWNDGGKVFSQGTDQPAIEVKQSGEGRFVGPPSHPFVYQFVAPKACRVTCVKFEFRDQTELWPRLSDAQATKVQRQEGENLSRTTAHPGVEALLRRHIAAFEAGKPLYDELGPDLARGIRGGLPQFQKAIGSFGRFQSLRYKSTLASGADVFSATYENGSLEWVIAPPEKDGRVYHMAFRPEK